MHVQTLAQALRPMKYKKSRFEILYKAQERLVEGYFFGFLAGFHVMCWFTTCLAGSMPSSQP